MANVIQKATNKWTKGLVMDFSPENTSNEVLTHALNATLLTFNGNEMSLQNDMGNGRVETAFLPEGYMPVGTCEYGGIIYIVSYNPLEDKSLIGCFPSPERNISNEELGMSNQYIDSKNFQGGIDVNKVFTPDGTLKNTSHKVILRNDKLNPGDKFIITSPESIYENQLADLYENNTLKPNPIIRLNVVSIEDSGRIVYLNNNIKQYENKNYKYYILGQDKSGTSWGLSKIDIDAYRDVLNSGYSVFKSKTSGKLAILAELIMVDTYSVTHSLQQTTIPNQFDIIIHTEASSEFSNDYNIAPKLKYYYLKESQGYVHDLTNPNDTKTPLFTESGGINPDFEKLELKEIFNHAYDGKLIEDKNNNPFNFPIKNTYYGNDISGNGTFEFLCDNDLKYPDVKLGTITLPAEPFNNSESFPFKYDYTIVPCMEYGRLDHLAVSNTIDFTHLHDFAQSKFNIWKYHIDGNLVTLTFGAEIYDTMQDNKVDALIVEFYDLWGFAGSFEISGKRSYSGVFTKILNLNTINALNKKQIICDDNIYKYSEQDYSRNIAIEKKSDGIYYLNNKPVKFISNKGWVYDDNTDDNTDDKLLNELSDCGVLYPNIIYGVKTYLRLTDSTNTQIFTPKQEFFLYTLPIFNDYYYIHDNFSILQPELELVLTYKLKENGTKLPYTSSDSKIINGWNNTDNNIITKYLGGSIEESIINAKQYYQFSGITNLYLEIGLKEEYNNYYLRYIKDSLNEKFSCDLQLKNNDNTGLFSVKSDIESSNLDTLLNYNSGDVNYNNNSITLSISNIPKLSTYNFTEGEQQAININYNFIVGYDINITDIIETEVPTTTVCALCHKNGETYNYEDFSMYEHESGEIYWKYMYYNRGNTTELEVGLATLISSNKNDDISKILSSPVISLKTDPYYAGPGKLNINFLKLAVDYIGKLTFCQPHAHALYISTESVNGDGTNMYQVPSGDVGKFGKDVAYYETDKDCKVEDGLFITSHINGKLDEKDIFCGTYGKSDYANNPLFNMSLNTQNSLLYYGEFLSTVNYKVGFGGKHQYIHKIGGNVTPGKYKWMMKYEGLNASELVNFNKALITTMKSVYAYNPDYDSYKTKIGNVIVQNKNTQIITNLISTNAKLNFTTDDSFINYICFGSMRISDYLEYLKTHSEITITNQPNLNILPNLKYCGEDSYLISQITYNIPKPIEIENQLTFNSNNQIMVKHEDGRVNFINGTLNKRTLYGYNLTYNKLIELNVNNYSIKLDGQLELNNILIPKTTTKEIKNFNINCESEDSQIIYSNDDLNIKLTSTATDGTHKFLKFSDNNLYLYVLPESNNMTLELKFECSTKLGTVRPRVSSSISAIGVELTKRLDGVDNNYTTDEYNILHLPIETLKLILVTHSSRANTTNVNVNLYKNDIPKLYNLQNGFIGNFNLYPINNPSSTDGEFKCPIRISNVNSALIEISIKSIILYFTHYESIYESTSDSIISIPNKVMIGGEFVDYEKQSSNGQAKQYKSNYPNQVIKYTNITLNDLRYDPFTENGHRLFIRNDCWQNISWKRNLIFYREAFNKNECDTANNILYLLTGPSFINE